MKYKGVVRMRNIERMKDRETPRQLEGVVRIKNIERMKDREMLRQLKGVVRMNNIERMKDTETLSVIHTALLNKVRKVGRLVLFRTFC
jgi:hypothetical protein